MKHTRLLASVAVAGLLAPLTAASATAASAAKSHPKPHPRHHKAKTQKPLTQQQIKLQKDRQVFVAYVNATTVPRSEFAAAENVIATGLPQLPSTPNLTWTQTAAQVQVQLNAMNDARTKMAAISTPASLQAAQQDYTQAMAVYHDWVAQLYGALYDESIPEFTSWASQLQSVETRAKSLKQAWQSAVIAEGKKLGVNVVIHGSMQ